MPRLQQTEETPVATPPIGSPLPGGVYRPISPVSRVATAISSPLEMSEAAPSTLPFLIGEVPDGLRRAADGEVAAAFAAVQSAYATRNAGAIPPAVTAIEVWQEIQSQRGNATRERQQIRRETARARRRKRQRGLAILSMTVAGIGLFVVGRTILPTPAPVVIPRTETKDAGLTSGGGGRTYSVPPTLTTTLPVMVAPAIYTTATLPNGATGWVNWETLVQLPREVEQYRRISSFQPIQQIYSQPLAGANWEVMRVGKQLYLRGFAIRPTDNRALVSGPITISSRPDSSSSLRGRSLQRINIPLDGQDFTNGIHTLSVGDSGETIQVRILRYDDRLWQP